ncbi:MAG: hypothetical protein IPK82_22695 [Polyangiaceae bacterium]|nr:hypothetical protein [Polyangiaceae bacterium]
MREAQKKITDSHPMGRSLHGYTCSAKCSSPPGNASGIGSTSPGMTCFPFGTLGGFAPWQSYLSDFSQSALGRS